MTLGPFFLLSKKLGVEGIVSCLVDRTTAKSLALAAMLLERSNSSLLRRSWSCSRRVSSATVAASRSSVDKGTGRAQERDRWSTRNLGDLGTVSCKLGRAERGTLGSSRAGVGGSLNVVEEEEEEEEDDFSSLEGPAERPRQGSSSAARQGDEFDDFGDESGGIFH